MKTLYPLEIKGNRKSRIFYALIVSLLALEARGDAIDAVLSRESERIEREKDRFLEVKREREPEVKEKECPEEKIESDSELYFESILLEGCTLLSSRDKEKITRPYLKKKIKLSDLQKLIRKVTNLYVEKGYSTTRVYLSEKSFERKSLILHIIEGKVEKVEILENKEIRKKRNTVLYKLEERPLNIRKLEQGIDAINRLNSMDAMMEIEGTEKIGYSKVIVNVEKKKAWRGGGSIDNYGSSTTGETEAEINCGADDLLGLYDSCYFSRRENREIYGSEKYSEATTGFFSVPFNDYTFSITGSYMKYKMTTHANLQPFEFTGDSQVYEGNIDKVIYRDSKSKTNLQIGFAFKKNRCYRNGDVDKSKTNELTSGKVKLSHARRMIGGVFSASIQYIQGLGWFGTEDNSTTQPNTPRGRYSKFVGDVGYSRSILSEKLQWRLNAHGQWTPQYVIGGERMSLGGNTSIRGFQDGLLTGDIGGYIRNELAYQLPKIKTYQPEFFIGYDIGRIYKDRANQGNEGIMAGIASGLRIRGEYAFGEFAISQNIRKLAHFHARQVLLSFQVGCNF